MSVPMQFRADKASHLPIAIENLDTGVASKLSSVPRSFSPAPISVPRYTFPTKPLVSMTSETR